jgi:hypothetical protein
MCVDSLLNDQVYNVIHRAGKYIYVLWPRSYNYICIYVRINDLQIEISQVKRSPDTVAHIR